jgi:hypothetical protein
VRISCKICKKEFSSKNNGHITEAKEDELKSKRKNKDPRQKKSRAAKRETISKLCETHFEVKSTLKLKGKTGVQFSQFI